MFPSNEGFSAEAQASLGGMPIMIR